MQTEHASGPARLRAASVLRSLVLRQLSSPSSSCLVHLTGLHAKHFACFAFGISSLRSNSATLRSIGFTRHCKSTFSDSLRFCKEHEEGNRAAV
jgi:hypothetical protein